MKIREVLSKINKGTSNEELEELYFSCEERTRQDYEDLLAEFLKCEKRENVIIGINEFQRLIHDEDYRESENKTNDFLRQLMELISIEFNNFKRETTIFDEEDMAVSKKQNNKALSNILGKNKEFIANEDEEKIEQISLEDIVGLQSFEHPFEKSLQQDEESINALAENIRENGIISPIIVRSIKGGKYEILSGHRRTKAARILKLDSIPCIVKDVDDTKAKEIVLDNLTQRDEILPSERAKAYKLKQEEMQAKISEFSDNLKTDTFEEVSQSTEISTENEDENFGCTECNAENTDGGRWFTTENGKQVLASLGVEYRTFYDYIKLTDLTDELLDLIDNKKLSIKVGVQLSKIDKAIQEFLPNYLEEQKLTENEAKILASEQQTLIGYNNAGNLTIESIKALIEHTIELHESDKKKPRSKINMSETFKQIKKSCNSFKGEDKKRFSKIKEERFREIVTNAVMQAIENELKEIGKSELEERDTAT